MAELPPTAQRPESGDSLPTTEPSTPSNGSTKQPVGHWRSTLNYFNREINISHADIPIIACCLVSGLCDSSSYNAWSCFVSMQTGMIPIHFPPIAKANNTYRQ